MNLICSHGRVEPVRIKLNPFQKDHRSLKCAFSEHFMGASQTQDIRYC